MSESAGFAEDVSPEAEALSPLFLMARMAEILEGLDVAMSVFDDGDRTLLWNRAFLRLFPEHANHVCVGEPYRKNLERSCAHRLATEEMPCIDLCIDEGIGRPREQEPVSCFQHQGRRVQVSSLPIEGLGRVRIWRAEVQGAEEAPLPRRTPTLGASALADGSLLEHMADSFMLTGLDGRITWVNEAFVSMYGVTSADEALSRRFQDLYRQAWGDSGHESDPRYAGALSLLEENLRFPGPPFELPLPRGRWTRVTIQRGPDGNSLSTHVDISVLKRQQHELRIAERRALQSNALLEAAFARMQQGVMMVNADRIVEICNKRAIELLGLPESLMASKPSFEAVLAFQWENDEFRHASPSMQDFVRAGGITNEPQTYDRVRPDGRIIEVQSVPIEGGGVLRTYTDITTRKRDEERIRHVSRHDGLTSLVNREVFLEHVGTAIAGSASFAVHYIDLDRFKPINDRHGHAVGDKVLACIAERMRGIARDRDVVARMGGDEFAILQRDVDGPEPAQGLADRLLHGVARPIDVEGHRLEVGASMGFALFPGKAHDVESLLREADAAMYSAKVKED